MTLLFQRMLQHIMGKERLIPFHYYNEVALTGTNHVMLDVTAPADSYGLLTYYKIGMTNGATMNGTTANEPNYNFDIRINDMTIFPNSDTVRVGYKAKDMILSEANVLMNMGDSLSPTISAVAYGTAPTVKTYTAIVELKGFYYTWELHSAMYQLSRGDQ